MQATRTMLLPEHLEDAYPTESHRHHMAYLLVSHSSANYAESIGNNDLMHLLAVVLGTMGTPSL